MMPEEKNVSNSHSIQTINKPETFTSGNETITKEMSSPSLTEKDRFTTQADKIPWRLKVLVFIEKLTLGLEREILKGVEINPAANPEKKRGSLKKGLLGIALLAGICVLLGSFFLHRINSELTLKELPFISAEKFPGGFFSGFQGKGSGSPYQLVGFLEDEEGRIAMLESRTPKKTFFVHAGDFFGEEVQLTVMGESSVTLSQKGRQWKLG
ncbi:MAG: hypothetical protein EXS63_06825 [Candidatus Omnitrophica bacterium]|nr:hypothetical protein [Candidatus Omnitrophota bacterium]